MKNIASMPMRIEPVVMNDDELAKVNRHTKRQFSTDELFLFSGTISDDTVDSFDTRMDPATTLPLFASDLLNGVSLLDGHNTNSEPYGRSFDSEIIQKEGVTRVVGHFYVLRNSNSNGRSTNDIIRNIEGGIIRDMSVGFSASLDDYICSADGKSYWDSPYFPGDRDTDGNPVFYWIKNATLREVSTVYKGANGNAFIEKARQAIANGEIDSKKINALEERFQTRFDDVEKSFFSTKKRKNEGVVAMEIKDIRAAITNGSLSVSKLREVMEENDVRFESQDNIAIRNALGDDATVESIRKLKDEAEAGRQYKKDLIEDAVKARVAIQGDGFNADNYRSMLERSDVEYIKDERESYEKMKGSKYTSGRQTDNGQQITDDVIVSELKGGK